MTGFFFNEGFWLYNCKALKTFFHELFLEIKGINDYSFKIKELINHLKTQDFTNLSDQQKKEIFYRFFEELKIQQKNYFKILSASYESLMKNHFSFGTQFCTKYYWEIATDGVVQKDSETLFSIITYYYDFIDKFATILKFIKKDYLNNEKNLELLNEFFNTFEKKNKDSIKDFGFIRYNYPVFISNDFEYFIQAKKEFFAQENANQALLNLAIEKNNTKFISTIKDSLLIQKEAILEINAAEFPESFSILESQLSEFFKDN